MNPSVDFVVQLFRILKLAGMHDLENQASVRAIDKSAEVFSGLLRTENDMMSALFADETVFVNGQPIRAERQIYDNAMEIGEMFARFGFNEITLFRGVSRLEIGKLVEMTARKGAMGWEAGPNIRVRYVDPSDIIGTDEAKLSAAEQAISVYSTAVVMVQSLERDARLGDLRLLRQIKKLAQRLANLAETAPSEMMTLALNDAGADLAVAKVHATILAVISACQITRDQHALMRIAYASLTLDLGKPRVSGMYRKDGYGASVVPQLNATMRARLPGSTALLLLESGRASDRATGRAVTAFEAQWLSNKDELQWPYDGKINPNVEAIIVRAAFRFVEFRTHQESPDVLMSDLMNSDRTRILQAASHLIFSAVGMFPAGTAVRLRNGAEGVVATTPTFSDLSRPVVRLIIDETRNPANGERVSANLGADWAIEAVIHDPSATYRERFRQVFVPHDAEEEIPTIHVADAVTPDPFSDFGTLERATEVEDLI